MISFRPTADGHIAYDNSVFFKSLFQSYDYKVYNHLQFLIYLFMSVIFLLFFVDTRDEWLASESTTTAGHIFWPPELLD